MREQTREKLAQPDSLTMAKSIDQSVGRFVGREVVPGTAPGRAERVRYVSFDPSQRPADLFESVVWKIKPYLAKNGGVVLDNFILRLPDGTPFYALELNGDLAGWQMQIERGAEELGLLSGEIMGDRFVVSDGRAYAVSDCHGISSKSWRDLKVEPKER